MTILIGKMNMREPVEFWLWGIAIITISFVILSGLLLLIDRNMNELIIAFGNIWAAIGVVLLMGLMAGLFVSFVLSIPYWIIMLIHYKFDGAEDCK